MDHRSTCWESYIDLQLHTFQDCWYIPYPELRELYGLQVCIKQDILRGILFIFLESVVSWEPVTFSNLGNVL